MRGLLFLLLAATAGAQDNRGFVNPGLAKRNIFTQALTAKPSTAPAPVLMDPPPPRCAIPLLEVPVGKVLDPGMVINPGKSGDEKMILPTIPVCGKR